MRTVTILLVFISWIGLSNYCTAQNKSTTYDPQRVMQFLDHNHDNKISQEEAKHAQRLANNFTYLDTNKDGFLDLEELKGTNQTTSRYTYLESEGVFIYYETQEKKLYRQLLPTAFDLPERLLVYTFICDFYKMDAATQPYKEASVFLLGQYKGKEVWHCIYMPVTSRESMLAGIHRLGLPKTMGTIDFVKENNDYKGTVTDENQCTMTLSIATEKYSVSKDEVALINQLSVIPKMNLLNGEVIEMGGGRNGDIFGLAQKYPNKVTIISGKSEIHVDTSTVEGNYPLNLTPSKILGGYYMLNKIPFRLGKK
ncbi:acetoacetate decarboxylase family protein [Flammeovirga agarivorans]|uniref:EF-hand domain-containing protein n=1 Tax=Flammeovirga agarivorans TaxID=2726742 RepID=A0A7X8SK13_9BACT|nr:acetoacetate decarboxylase family protein [Flammeovirga agarivorans]NLR91674.1 hypothetical protein [Flammeovirga agarivorans]